jgi:hypothetical protein
MNEALVALVGILLCGFLTVLFWVSAGREDTEMERRFGHVTPMAAWFASRNGRLCSLFLSTLFGMTTLYFIVRFLHWAWEIHIPFVS